MRFFKNITKEKLKHWLKKILWLLLNPRLLLCLLIAWMITNGWSYIFIAVGAFFQIKWMFWIGTAYGGFLWFPFTPEKILTVIIAIFLLRVFFPKDEKTLGVLKDMLHRFKVSHEESKKQRKLRKEEKRRSKQSTDMSDSRNGDCDSNSTESEDSSIGDNNSTDTESDNRKG